MQAGPRSPRQGSNVKGPSFLLLCSQVSLFLDEINKIDWIIGLSKNISCTSCYPVKMLPFSLIVLTDSTGHIQNTKHRQIFELSCPLATSDIICYVLFQLLATIFINPSFPFTSSILLNGMPLSLAKAVMSWIMVLISSFVR